jgi:hypothetical protein
MYFLLYEMSVSKVKSREGITANMSGSLKSLGTALSRLIGTPVNLASELIALIGKYLQKNEEVGITKFHYRVILEIPVENNEEEVSELLNEMLEKRNEGKVPPSLHDVEVSGKVFVNCNHINQDDLCDVQFKGLKLGLLGKSYNIMSVANESAISMQDKKTPENMAEFKKDSE